MNTRATVPNGDCSSAPVRLVLQTGRDDCRAYFSPARFQLIVVAEGLEERIDLGYSGSRLLERLLQSPNEVISREELMSFAWADRVVGQGSLNQQVYTLRQLLGDDKRRDIIQTLPRRGYLFNANYLIERIVEPVSEVDASNTLSDPPDVVHDTTLPAPAGSLPATPKRAAEPPVRRPRGIAAAVALASALLCGAAVFQHADGQSDQFQRELMIGPVHSVLLGNDEQTLEHLAHRTEAFRQRLGTLAQGPVEVALSMEGEFYHLVCLRTSGTMRWLQIHRDQLDRLQENELRTCLL